MRDYDLFGLHRELGISDGGTSGQHEGSSPATTTSTSDENGDESPSTSAARVVGKKPTRAKTYHGVGDSGRSRKQGYLITMVACRWELPIFRIIFVHSVVAQTAHHPAGHGGYRGARREPIREGSRGGAGKAAADE
jgi:hypothetical protein